MTHSLGTPNARSSRSGALRTPPRSWVDQVFDEIFAPFAGPAVASSIEPRTNVVETEGAFHVEVELPGLSRDDIDITFENGALQIRGERTSDVSNEARVRRGRWSGRFSRTLRFRKPVDAEAITANLEHGVLSLELPLAPEARAKRIEIR